MRIYATNSHLFIGAVLLAGLSISANASVIQYSDQASFSAATSGITTIGFEGIAPANSDASFSTASGLTLNNVNFVGQDTQFSGYDLRVEDDTTPGDNWNSGDYLVGPPDSSPGNSRITVSLPANVYAVGSNIMYRFYNGSDYSSGPASTFNIVLSTGSTVYTASTVAGYASMAFTGFVSTTPISTITFYSQNSSNAVLDNFQFGQAGGSQSQTPETGTWLLSGVGLILLAAGWRRGTPAAQN